MYLNLIQLAESFGVSEKVIEGWIRDEGLPHIPDHGVLLFDRAQVVQWATTRGLAAQAGFLAEETPALGTVLRLCPSLRAGGIWRDVAAMDLPDVFSRVAAALPLQDHPVDDVPVTRLLFFIAPSPRAHLDMVGRISRLLSGHALREALDKGATDEEIYQVIDVADTAAATPRKPEVKS